MTPQTIDRLNISRDDKRALKTMLFKRGDQGGNPAKGLALLQKVAPEYAGKPKQATASQSRARLLNVAGHAALRLAAVAGDRDQHAEMVALRQDLAKADYDLDALDEFCKGKSGIAWDVVRAAAKHCHSMDLDESIVVEDDTGEAPPQTPAEKTRKPAAKKPRSRKPKK